MTPARYATALLLLFAPVAARGQLLGTNIEIFGTAGAVAGVARVKVASGTRVAAHGGVRFDGGIQTSRIGFGLGARYWEMALTSKYEGHGLDGFLFGEVRPGNSLHTTIRGALGVGLNDFDSDERTLGSTITYDATIWSVGVGHELLLRSGARVILSADLIMAGSTPGPIGRRPPVLEFGMGYRFRDFTIDPPHTRHR